MERADRLRKAFDYVKSRGFVHTQKDLSTRMQASEGNVSKALKGEEQILTDSFLRRFNTAFDNIFNSDWLLTGNGEMLEATEATAADQRTVIDDMDNTYSIPLLPVSAQGGSLNDFVVSVKESDCEKIISPIKGADYAMSVAGDSMAPEYPSGSQILIKRINERAFIDWGKVYVLDTCNGTVIKRLFPSKKPEMVLCKSINPKFPPFEVSMSDVYGVYRVLMCMSVK